MRQREDGCDACIADEEFAHEFRAVALSAAVKQDDVAGETIGAAGGLRAIEDGLNGGEGLLVAEMPAAAHDALLEIPGAIAGAFHFGVVIGFHREEIDAAESFDEHVGHVAEVGGETGAVTVAGDEEAVGAFFIVSEFHRLEGDAADGLEFAVKAVYELGQGGVAETFGDAFGFGVATFGGVEDFFDPFAGAEDADASLDDRLQPVFVEVVVIEVCEDDGGDVGEVDAEASVA